MHFLISVAVLVEILWLTLGLYTHFRKDTDLNSQAVAYALISAFAIFSLSLQAFFFFGLHQYYFLFDVFLISASTFLIYRNWETLGRGFAALGGFCTRNRAFAMFISAMAAVPFAKGFLLPPTTYDSLTYHLARVMMMKSEGQLFLDNFSDYRLDIMTVGYDILHFLFLRFHTDFGLATFGFLSYLLVLAAVYALVQRLWDNEVLAKTVTLVGASLTMFVLHAASTKNDLILGSITAVAFLAAYNFRRSKGLSDLHILGIALGFGVTAKYTFGYMGLAFLAAFLVVLVREWGLAETGRHIGRFCVARGGALLVLPLGLVATLIVVLAHNAQIYGHLMGPEFYMPSFSAIDGFRGGVVNLLRFLVQMLNLPMEVFGLSITKLHNMLLGDNVSIGVLWWPERKVILETAFNPPEEAAWFGYLGFPLLLAMIYGAVKGDRFIKAVSLSALVVIVLVAMTTSWSLWRGRYYAGPIVAGLIGLGFWLHQLGLTRPGLAAGFRRGMITISAANLIYLTIWVAAADFSKLSTLFTERDTKYAGILGGMPLWRQFVDDTPVGARVLLVTALDERLFPLYLRRPDLVFIPAGVYSEFFRESLELDGATYTIAAPKDLAALWGRTDQLMMVGVSNEFRAGVNALAMELNNTPQ